MVRRFQTSRFALSVYGLLLVLPTLVLGVLYWHQLERDYDGQLQTVPEDARDAARRVAEGMRTQLLELLERERRRPYFEYAEVFSPPDTLGDQLVRQPSPLTKSDPPRGVLGWFNWDGFQSEGEIGLFLGDRAADAGAVETQDRLREELMPVLGRFRTRKEEIEGFIDRAAALAGATQLNLPISVIAVHYVSPGDSTCIRDCYEEMRDWTLTVDVSSFAIEFFIDADKQPRAIASRRVVLTSGSYEFPTDAPCLSALTGGFGLWQGLVLDVDWLFDRLPRGIAQRTLTPEQELVEAEADFPMRNVGKVFAEILPVREFQFETRTREEERFGALDVRIDIERIAQHIARQKRRFLGVGLMLVVTLLTGMTLLYRNVRRELDQAGRMQDFVAAVTHELRTPLSTIRLHGEMLLEGWTDDPEKKQDYYRRIVRETDRLSTLVERVLEKSRLKEDKVEPKPGNLDTLVEALVPGLEAPDGGTADLALALEPELPPVLLTHEAVAGILSNLIENARKYAPAERLGEPILIRLSRAGSRVHLDVADRGPGVPASEKDRVFEAFYRSGREATRRTQGTGLGLHLVQLHAQSVGGRASVHDREGGGSVFRVAFRVSA